MRIEDIDQSRSRMHYAQDLLHDFEMLGLTWDGEVIYQSKRQEFYDEMYDQLVRQEHVYPCFCTRSERLADAAAAPHGLHVYAGRCRRLSDEEIQAHVAHGIPFSMRLEVPDERVVFQDLWYGEVSVNLAHTIGDSIIRRADGGYSYQFAVSVDDAEMGITHVIRGVDLLESSALQMFLTQRLIGRTCHYGHIPLLSDKDGQRLAKRHRSASLDELLISYPTKDALIGHVAYLYGLIDEDEPASAEELVTYAHIPESYSMQHIIWIDSTK